MVAPNRSVRQGVHHAAPMFLIELTCGEEPCEVTIAVVSELAELEALVCDECGYCLHLLSISAVEYVEIELRPALLLAA